MTTPSSPTSAEPDLPDSVPGELVDHDDAVIGRALRLSLWIFVGLAAVGGLIAFVLTRPEEAVAETELATTAPERIVQEATPPELRFTDITREAGIDFVHRNGAEGEKLLPETMGGGVAFLDVDGDGDSDLLFVNGTAWPHLGASEAAGATPALYQNDGTGRFTDVTRQAGLEISLYGMGAAVADIDGDGDPDLYLTAVGGNRLLRNDGGVFRDITAATGVGGGDDDWSTGAAFFDADGDGDLDLFVCNYVRWSRQIDHQVDFKLDGVGRAFGPPTSYAGTFPALYRNDGPGGNGPITFTDISEAAGLHVVHPATGAPVAKSLALAPLDVDGDGHLDVFVANDTVQNFLFHNQGDGTFVEAGEEFGVAYDENGQATGAMGTDAGHLRNDGDLALLIGNFANEMSSVYVREAGSRTFFDAAIAEGIGAPSRRRLTFGLLTLDLDLDGRLDVLQANGHVEDQIARVEPSQSYRQAAQLFWNAGPEAHRAFVEIPPVETGDLGMEIVGRGAAYADIDGDGDLDVVLTQIAGPPLLLRNDQATDHHWLRVKLAGRAPNRDAIGAWVILEAGDTVLRRRMMPTRSYLSQVEPVITFGLGTTDRIDTLTVVWPDGVEEHVAPPPEIDRLHVIERSSSGPVGP